MAKNYTEVESLKVIKDLLNLLYGDTKRFNVLRNKFKKSVTDFKVKDNKIVEVQFASVTQQVINDELEVAIESLKGYAARSAKKQAEFDAIIECKGIDLEAAKTSKTKTIKVTKTDSGKLAKVVKDSSLPKEKEPKEVKKVKNKNEPAKSKSAKTTKSVVSKDNTKKKSDSIKKSDTEKNTVEDLIKIFVNNLNEKETKTLISNTIVAFSGDSKLNVTMTNWVKKTNNDKDAAIGMFTSAYTRKPKNSKMQEWYKKLEATFEAPENQLLIYKEEKKPEVEIKEIETPKVNKPTEEFNIELYSNVFIHRSLTQENASKFHASLGNLTLNWLFEQKPLEQINIVTKLSIPDFIAKYIATYDEICMQNQELDFEGVLLSNGILNCYVSAYLYNLDFAILKSGGFNFVQPRATVLGLIKAKLGMNTLDSFASRTHTMTQLEAYTFARKVVVEIFRLSLNEVQLLKNMVNVFGEVLFRSAQHLEDLKEFVEVKDCAPVASEEVSTEEVTEEATKEPEDDTIKYSITTMDICFVHQNTTFNVAKMDPKYSEIKEAVINNDKEALNKLVLTKDTLQENIKNLIVSSTEDDTENMDIKIVDKNIMYNGKIYKGHLSAQFVKYLAENNTEMIKLFKNFIANCNMNPSHNSIEELYDFVFVNKLKVTPTGTVLLYKWVNNDYKDCHTNTFLNTPGLTVKMDRSRVNNDRNETCSRGLHLCSYGYGKFGDRLLLCEVHPKDVVSIPTDYNRSKLRCCQYTTLIDITEYWDEFSKKGDFLSIAKNIHYNPKVLEIEIMKLYPSVRRKNSKFSEINGLSADAASKILFSGLNEDEEVVIVKNEEIDVTENEEIMNEEMNEKFDSKEEPEKIKEPEELKEEPEELEEVEEEPVVNKERINLEFIEKLNDFIATKMLNDILLDNVHFELIFTMENFGFDGIIRDKILVSLGIDSTNYRLDKISDSTRISFYTGYRNLLDDAHSVAQIEDEAYTSQKDLSDVLPHQNPDNVKVMETPAAKEENLVSKVKGFFKKLF